LGNNNKILSVFDFDGVLADTNSSVYVIKNEKVIKKLTPKEYVDYEPLDGESFDYSEFNKMIKNPKLIVKNFKILVNQLEKARKSPKGSRKVTILTARGIGIPVTAFFKTFGLKPYVVALGSGDPKDKADWVENEITKPNGYDTLYFMDDAEENINAINEMLKKYPEVESVVTLIEE